MENPTSKRIYNNLWEYLPPVRLPERPVKLPTVKKSPTPVSAPSLPDNQPPSPTDTTPPL